MDGRKHIKQTLMERDDLTSKEADESIQEVRNEMDDLLAEGKIMEAMDVCEMVGLEPDYIEDLL